MKTNVTTRRRNTRKNGSGKEVENCKLERLKMTGAYAPAPQAEAWAEGLQARQEELNCAVLRPPKRASSRRRPVLKANHGVR